MNLVSPPLAATTNRNSRPSVVAIAMVGATLAGTAVGFGTQILQGSLSGSWSVLANSGVMWILASFGVGLMMPSRRVAAFGGALALVAASISFYVAVEWLEGVSSEPAAVIIWATVGVIAGSVFGAAGHIARRSRHHRPAAWALLAGVLAGEGIHLVWFVGNPELRPAGITEIGLATIVTVGCLARARNATHAGAIAVAAASITLFAFHFINDVFAAR